MLCSHNFPTVQCRAIQWSLFSYFKEPGSTLIPGSRPATKAPYLWARVVQTLWRPHQPEFFPQAIFKLRHSLSLNYPSLKNLKNPNPERDNQRLQMPLKIDGREDVIISSCISVHVCSILYLTRLVDKVEFICHESLRFPNPFLSFVFSIL